MQPDKTSIGNKSFGGLKFAFREVQSTGQPLGTPDSWHDGMYRMDSDLGFDQPDEIIELENGATGNVVPGTDSVVLEIESAQLDAALIAFTRRTMKGKYYQLFLDAGKGSAGKKLEIFYCLGKFQRTLRWTGKTRHPKVKFTGIFNETALTPNVLPTWAAGQPTDFATAIGEMFQEKET